MHLAPGTRHTATSIQNPQPQPLGLGKRLRSSAFAPRASFCVWVCVFFRDKHSLSIQAHDLFQATHHMHVSEYAFLLPSSVAALSNVAQHQVE